MKVVHPGEPGQVVGCKTHRPATSVGLPICDLGTGTWAVQGILAALYERQRTGKGVFVECSLLETAIGFSSWTSAQWLADHEGRPARARAIARTHPISACRPRTAI